MSGLPARYRIAFYAFDDEMVLETIRGEEVATFSAFTPIASVRRVARAHEELLRSLALEPVAEEEPNKVLRAAFRRYAEAGVEQAGKGLTRAIGVARRAASTQRGEVPAWAG